MEKGIARVEPAQCRQDRQCAVAQLGAGRREKFAHWSNSIRPDESVDLDPERDERDEKNQTDRAKKPGARPKIGWRANVIAPEKPRDHRSESAITRDNFVKAFRDRRKTRKMIVTPRRPLLGRSTS